jgi:peptidoglycan/xylan/chitin deacetylase (PgdA/CDA1 family)
MKPYSAMNINFDSLSWILGNIPKDFRDESFFSVADMFFNLSDKFNFKYTIFVIGKDLERKENRVRVKEWSDSGHEIGNHSYSHKPNLGWLSKEKIEKEIKISHDIIKEVCGIEPSGFISPAWSYSRNLKHVLVENGYLYDTSLFPTSFYPVVMIKNLWNFRNDMRKKDIVIPNTLSYGLSNRPSYDGKIVNIPLPTFFGMPCWHTLSFILPSSVFEYLLKKCLNKKYFYYLP